MRLLLIALLLLPCLAWGAPPEYNDVDNGDWNDTNTWGTSSWPSQDNAVVTIDSHNVEWTSGLTVTVGVVNISGPGSFEFDYASVDAHADTWNFLGGDILGSGSGQTGHMYGKINVSNDTTIASAGTQNIGFYETASVTIRGTGDLTIGGVDTVEIGGDWNTNSGYSGNWIVAVGDTLKVWVNNATDPLGSGALVCDGGSVYFGTDDTTFTCTNPVVYTANGGTIRAYLTDVTYTGGIDATNTAAFKSNPDTCTTEVRCPVRAGTNTLYFYGDGLNILSNNASTFGILKLGDGVALDEQYLQIHSSGSLTPPWRIELYGDAANNWAELELDAPTAQDWTVTQNVHVSWGEIEVEDGTGDHRYTQDGAIISIDNIMDVDGDFEFTNAVTLQIDVTDTNGVAGTDYDQLDIHHDFIGTLDNAHIEVTIDPGATTFTNYIVLTNQVGFDFGAGDPFNSASWVNYTGTLRYVAGAVLLDSTVPAAEAVVAESRQVVPTIAKSTWEVENTLWLKN